jgi:hypothetical protein
VSLQNADDQESNQKDYQKNDSLNSPENIVCRFSEIVGGSESETQLSPLDLPFFFEISYQRQMVHGEWISVQGRSLDPESGTADILSRCDSSARENPTGSVSS